MEGDIPPTKKGRVDTEEVAGPSALPHPVNHIQENELAVVIVFRSPNTTPILEPEIWGTILGYLPPEELKTALNTCPEWNELMGKQKTTVLFPKVMDCIKTRLRFIDVLQIRLVSKAWKAAADSSIPQIPKLIEPKVQLKRDYDALKARIRLGMRRRARAEFLRANGLPEEVYDANAEEEFVPENEFSDEEMRAYLLQRVQDIAAQYHAD